MGINCDGLIVGIFAFFCIGIFHPIVIKTEYYIGKKAWPVFLAAGIVSIIISVFLEHYIAGCCLSILGITCLWSIHELVKQEERVRKGWFPDGRKEREKNKK